MKIRHVYSAGSLETARECVATARALGLTDHDIALVADSSVVVDPIPEEMKPESPTDFVPAALRGAIGGGSVGVLAGLVAAVIPPLGITLAGAGLMGVIGAAVGTWSGALVGASIPSEVHRTFEERVRAGDVLVVLDIEPDRRSEIDSAMHAVGARRFDYEARSALT